MEVRVLKGTAGAYRVHRVFGQVTFGELLMTLQPFFVHRSERAPANALWDFTQASSALSSDEVERLADLVGQHLGRGGHPRAAIVAADDLGFGLARVYSARIAPRTDHEVRIFRGREEAIQWLDTAGA